MQHYKGSKQYHEQIDVIMVIWVVGVVHAEGSVNVTIQDVIKFLKGLIWELSWSSEALPQVGTFKEDNIMVKSAMLEEKQYISNELNDMCSETEAFV